MPPSEREHDSRDERRPPRPSPGQGTEGPRRADAELRTHDDVESASRIALIPARLEAIVLLPAVAEVIPLRSDLAPLSFVTEFREEFAESILHDRMQRWVEIALPPSERCFN
jgi:hypothetical protein